MVRIETRTREGAKSAKGGRQGEERKHAHLSMRRAAKKSPTPQSRLPPFSGFPFPSRSSPLRFFASKTGSIRFLSVFSLSRVFVFSIVVLGTAFSAPLYKPALP